MIAAAAALALVAALGPVPADEPPIRHAHSSSLYDGPKSELRAQMKRLVRARNPSANLATLTEVGSAKRTRILKDAAPGKWGAWVPNQSDVGVMWNKNEWSVVKRKPRKLTDLVWTDGKGRKHTTWILSIGLRHIDGHTLYVSVCHLPSHVEYGNRFRDNAQSRAWKSAVKGWHKRWTAIRKKYNPDAGMLVADWNIDFFRPHWRNYLQRVFPALHLNWKGHMPSKGPGKGTHGRRLIDGTMATMRADRSRLLKDDDSSDHRPFGSSYSWPK